MRRAEHSGEERFQRKTGAAEGIAAMVQGGGDVGEETIANEAIHEG